jgi:hypothetical protein
MDAHEALLDRWSRQEHHRDKYFIKDGIIAPSRWRLANPKALLLLKEAYHDGTEKWDYRSYLKEWNGKNPTLRSAAYWCYAIHHIFRGDLPRLPSDANDYEKAIEALRSSAIVNIKKSEGRHSSSDKEIQRYADLDKRFIQQQIDFINPDIVVCGNTWPHIQKWWAHEMVSAGVYRVGRRIFVDFLHPSSRGSDEMKYYALAGQLISFFLADGRWKVTPRPLGKRSVHS